MEKNQTVTQALLPEGLLIGYLATQALDWVSTVIYENESNEVYREENAARDGHHAYENGIRKMAELAGRDLTEEQIRDYGWKFHRTFGTLSGVQYALLRKKFPNIGWGFGALYGLGFFILVDEILMPVLGLTPGPAKFSWKVHARGFAAHMAYGLASEISARALETALRKSTEITQYARRSSLGSGHKGDRTHA